MTDIKEAWRVDDSGQLDDIVVPDVRLFRMERMDDDEWWIGLHLRDGRLIHLHVTASASPSLTLPCFVTVEKDEQ